MKEKKLIAFNMYSTWVDMPKSANPYSTLFSSLWISRSVAKQLSLLLQTTNQDIQNILPQDFLEQKNTHLLLKQFDEDIQHQLDSISLYPDFISTIYLLKAKWYTTAVVSNLSKPYEYPLTHLLPKDIFDYNILSFEVGSIKPNIQIFQKLKDTSWLLPSDIVMVGDSLSSDVQWAKNAHIDAIHIDRASSWIIYHKDHISISALEQLLDIL